MKKFLSALPKIYLTNPSPNGKRKQTIEELQGLAKNEPEKALLTVKKIIKEYPYFMAARILELDILKAINQKDTKMPFEHVRCKPLREMSCMNI